MWPKPASRLNMSATGFQPWPESPRPYNSTRKQPRPSTVRRPTDMNEDDRRSMLRACVDGKEPERGQGCHVVVYRPVSRPVGQMRCPTREAEKDKDEEGDEDTGRSLRTRA